MRLLTGRLRDQWHGMSRSGRVAAAFAHSPEPTLRMHPGDAQRRGLVAGELVQIASKRGALVLPLELSDELRSGTVFAPMHWSGQSLSSGGINEVSTPAVDARSQQPELKHTAVRVEKTTFGWHLLAARRGDAIALQQTLQPLLRDCGYASLRLHAEPLGGSRRHASGDWVVLHAACERAPDATWMDRLVAALRLPAGADVLEYRDLRRGLMRRVGWRMHDGHHHIDGVLLTAAQPSDAKNRSLLATALAGKPWHGARLSVFAHTHSAAGDPIVCTCMHVSASAIHAAIDEGADLAQLKQRLGCGTVCGSCVRIPKIPCLASGPAASVRGRHALAMVPAWCQRRPVVHACTQPQGLSQGVSTWRVEGVSVRAQIRAQSVCVHCLFRPGAAPL